MIVRVLADTPDCRDGDCPTAYLTDHGTVILQGYQVAAEMHAVEVPEAIITAAAAELTTVCPGADWSPPTKCARITGQGTAVVPGNSETADVVGTVVPEGEKVVEVCPEVIIDAARRILSPGRAA